MTIEQKQCLLTFLGYDTGGVDGIWGAKSVEATKALQRRVGLEDDGIFGPLTENAATHAVYYGLPDIEEDPDDALSDDEFWAGIKYWSRKEFKCRCWEYHAPYCDGYPVEPDRNLVLLADQVREHFGRPGHRSSGIRCVQHNADSDGVANSKHLYGKALDFRIEGHTSAEVLAYVLTLPGVHYAYAIDGMYVHMDVE